ncbi:MAG: SDR family oxidoreductase [Alphaproteobacteria bacterium]|nr:SDR family oxidoreductase [Alphaproteobacteria bacterium]
MTQAGAIVVTGANRGIGAGIALELARRGFTVACLSRTGNLPDMVGEDGAAGAPPERLIAGRLDVTDERASIAVLGEIARAHGGLRGLVNNAGMLLTGKSEGFATAEFTQTLDTNVTSAFILAKAAYPHFLARGGGTIVNIGSFWERLGVRYHLAYCASKAALGALTRCLAVEWAKQNIAVYNVAPGYVATDMNRAMLESPSSREWLARRIPVGRPGRVDEVARLVAALLVEEIRYLTGETIVMDGGQSINQ